MRMIAIKKEEEKGEEEDVEERKQDRLDTCQTQRSQSHPNEDPPFFVWPFYSWTSNQDKHTLIFIYIHKNNTQTYVNLCVICCVR